MIVAQLSAKYLHKNHIKHAVPLWNISSHLIIIFDVNSLFKFALNASDRKPDATLSQYYLLIETLVYIRRMYI